MNELDSLKFSNRFAELPEDLFHKQNWTPFDKPKLIHFNEDLAKQLGFPKNLDPEDLVPYVNGNKSFKNSSPLAMAYACLLYTSPSPRDRYISRMPSSA